MRQVKSLISVSNSSTFPFSSPLESKLQLQFICHLPGVQYKKGGFLTPFPDDWCLQHRSKTLLNLIRSSGNLPNSSCSLPMSASLDGLLLYPSALISPPILKSIHFFPKVEKKKKKVKKEIEKVDSVSFR